MAVEGIPPENVLLKIARNIKAKWRRFLPWLGLFAIYYGIGVFLPAGYDWVHFFSVGTLPGFWTPWTLVVLKFANLPLIFAITLFAITYRAYHYNRSPLPIALAILSLPTLWVLFLGNLDGLVLAGILILPWGAPLAIMKPQLAAFALLAKKKSFLAGVVWVIISLAIWGFWPSQFKLIINPEWQSTWASDITLFPWGLIIGLPLMWLSRGDEDLLMAAGSFITPHLFPYHFILLMPALSRMKPGWMIVTWLTSWLPLLANWIGPIGWHFGNILGVLFWIGIYASGKSREFSRLEDGLRFKLKFNSP